MKRLMTVAFATVVAAGAYASSPCGDPCNTYDFKAALTKPVGKVLKVTDPCGGCNNYRTKASGALNGWLVQCDPCGDATLVVVVDKEKTAYVTTEMGLVLLNQMGKPVKGMDCGAEIEAAFGFILCDPTPACVSEQTDGPFSSTPGWSVAAAGFGKVKAVAVKEKTAILLDKITLLQSALITDLSGTLVGIKPGAELVSGSVCSEDVVCTCVCDWCPDLGTANLDAVSGTWTLKYNAKTSLDPFPAIKAALIKKGVTTVIDDCDPMPIVAWRSVENF